MAGEPGGQEKGGGVEGAMFGLTNHNGCSSKAGNVNDIHIYIYMYNIYIYVYCECSDPLNCKPFLLPVAT